MTQFARLPLAAGRSGLPGLSTASMITSDGIRLDADIWTPMTGEGPWPVLLMRQAYGRRLGSSLCYAHPAWYASQGFLVVIQDVRGRGSSEGTFKAFEHEGQDGAEAIRWAACLPGSNGRVGLYGFSYQGTNQLLAAAHRPPALRAMAPAMIGWDLFADWASENGAMRLASNVGWGIQMAAGTAQHERADDAWYELFAASRALPLSARINARPQVLERWRNLGHYHEWLERDGTDSYWARVSPSHSVKVLRHAALPALFIAGWFDTHLAGTLAAHDALAGSGGSLVVGPWTHFPWDRRVGDCDFGAEAVTPIDRMQVSWFRRWLTDDADNMPEPMLHLFDMGTNRWRTRGTWPQTRQTFYPGGSGLASIDGEAGTLDLEPAGETNIEYIVHDPWRPAPSVGGAYGTPPGPVDRSAVDRRSDVLTFTTPPLERLLDLFGSIEADLAILSDRSAFDLACTLSRVDPAGRVLQIAEGFRSVVEHRQGDRVAVSLRRTCATLTAGERLRLSIAAASFPAYPVNPGTGARAIEAAGAAAQVITLGIPTGGEEGARLHLTTNCEVDI